MTRTYPAIIAFALAFCGRASADGDAVAIVNGASISKADMVRVLMDVRGLDVMQQFILLECARSETKARNIRITNSDVEREWQDALDRIAKDAGVTGDAATPANKEQALETMLAQKRIARAEYRLAIERNAHLRKLVEADLKINDETLRAEWSRTHGERRVVRHIPISVRDQRALTEALNMLRGGADFAEVARRLSDDPDTRARGGEMDPFTFDNPDIPAALREQVFMMKPGEVSNPVKCEEMFHIVKLERIIAPDGAKFEDVRGDVEKEMKTRVVDLAMQKLARELHDKAKITVLEPALKSKYEAFVKEAKPATP